MLQLQLGAVQVLQHAYVKGVWNVLKSWTYIKRLQTEALDFAGPEREIIRSVALITLGGFNLILSLLPDTLKRAGAFLSGFDGDREIGLAMVKTCWLEGGILAPWGALSWLQYQVDTKTFVGEEQVRCSCSPSGGGELQI
jgi:hypothetical protein